MEDKDQNNTQKDSSNDIGENTTNVIEERNRDDQAYSFDANNSSEESELGSYLLKVTEDKVIPGPSKVIGSSCKTLFASILDTVKKPTKLIPAIVLAVIWLVINILQASGVNPPIVRVISFLTFADAGTHGGFIGAVGGIIGKGFFAGAVVVLVDLFKHRNKGEKRSFKETIIGSFGVGKDTLWVYLLGIGVAMFFFLFISGGATRISFMGGIATAYLAARAALNCGFLQMFIASFVSKGKEKASPGVAGCVRGLSTGFIASALIGLINVNLVLIIIGSILVVGGTVMTILQATGAIKLGKEQAK